MKDLVDVLKDIMYPRLVDLKRRFDIRFTMLPTGQWEAIDLETFDPDPESGLCLAGHGDTTSEAVNDLLEKIAAAVTQS